MSKTLRWLLFFVGFMSAPAFAQVTGPPFVFTAGTVINPDEVNLNFSTIYAAACNRGGCTMTGNLLFSADNSHDIGASGTTRPRDLFLGRNAAIGGTLGVTGTSAFAAISGTNATFSGTLGVTGATTLSSTLGVSGATTLAALSATTGTFSSTLGVTGAATLTSTLAVNSTSAAAIDVAGGITAGSGNVGIIDTSGRIPAISSTYVASLSGANLTSIPETAITDGSLLARVGSTETISGTWTFSTTLATAAISATGTITATATGNTINVRPNAGADGYLTWTENAVADRWALGIDDGSGSLRGRLTNTTGATAFEWDGSGNFIQNFGVRFSSAITPSAIPGSSSTNDYDPTGFSTAFLVRISSTGASALLTGMAAQSSGSIRVLCNVGANTIQLVDDGASLAANRYQMNGSIGLAVDACAPFIYDGSSSRWRALYAF